MMNEASYPFSAKFTSVLFISTKNNGGNFYEKIFEKGEIYG